MRDASPQASGLTRGEALPALGGVLRYRCSDGDGEGELWRFPADQPWPREVSHQHLAEQLFERARCGWFGFTKGGHDEAGSWLLRLLPPHNLTSRMKATAGPWRWQDAVRIAVRLATALEAAEDHGLFIGALTPSRIWVADDPQATDPQATDPQATDPQAAAAAPLDTTKVWLRGEALLLALVGARSGGRHTATQASDVLWAPPERADEERWGHAHNRYALGAVLYRMLAGAHPFGGAGLRHAMREAARAEPAPFSVAVRRNLPAGLQSLCLRLIAKDPGKRPASACDIRDKLQNILDTPAAVRGSTAGGQHSRVTKSDIDNAEAATSSPPSPRHQERRSTRPPAQRRHSRDGQDAAATSPRAAQSAASPLAYARRYAPLLLGLACLAAAAAWWQSSDEPAAVTKAPITISDARPLDALHTSADDCASCHPRHTAEWSQSVMGHAVKSPLFNALEALIEEQVGRDFNCPNGAGILRRADPNTACRDAASGVSITGSGGEHWCINCHSPGDNLASAMPAWQGLPGGDPRSRLPVRDLISPLALEGISCAFCHQVQGPVGPRNSGGYEGNPSWISFLTGTLFESRPEDRRGVFGIANSGYRLNPAQLLLDGGRGQGQPRVLLGDGGAAVHAGPTDEARRYLQSSQFCGSCHDVRLFGSDVLGSQLGEHFKRLRNAYSEWDRWAQGERAAGRRAASCQDCHMSTYPGVCVPGDERAGNLDDEACPDNMRFEEHQPGRKTAGYAAVSSRETSALTPHYFAGVDLPLAPELRDEALDQPGVDHHGLPLSVKRRRDLLLRRSLTLKLGETERRTGQLTIPIEIENVGAGHRVPAGFSQEREIWLHLRISDSDQRLVYEVGRVDRNDQDLADKVFLRINTDPNRLDGAGRPIGLFGADIADGPDVPQWSPPPELGGNDFRGRGLINFQNGFLRCVRCIGTISADGQCQPRFGERHRAERFADGDYDLDTGECRSNLTGRAALFEIFFPVGGLDADRGIVRGPDAIIDTRSLAPHEPVRYVYELSTAGFRPPFQIDAKLMFRSFPPFLVRAFAEYEQRQAQAGKRPSGPLVTFDMLKRLERVELARQTLTVP